MSKTDHLLSGCTFTGY